MGLVGDSRQAADGEESCDQPPRALGRITAVTKHSPQVLGDTEPATCRANTHARGAEHHPLRSLHQHHISGDRLACRYENAARCPRQDDQRQGQRDCKRWDRDVGFAKPATSITIAPDAGRTPSMKAAASAGRQRDVDTHESSPRASPPMIRDDTHHVDLARASAMNGSASSSVTKIASIFGTKDQRLFRGFE